MKFYSLLVLACGLCHVGAAPIRTVIVTETVWVTNKGGVETSTADAEITTTSEAISVTTEATTTTGGLLDQLLNGASDGLFLISSLDVQFGVNKISTTSVEGTTISAVTTTTAETTTPAETTTTAETTTSAAISTSTSTSTSSGSYSGEGTFYDTGLGACGWVNSDSDYIVAMDIKTFNAHNVDGNPNHNSLCGKKIRAYHEGKSVDVKVVDACEGCLVNDLDFSPSAFEQLAAFSVGRIDITWEWL